MPKAPIEQDNDYRQILAFSQSMYVIFTIFFTFALFMGFYNQALGFGIASLVCGFISAMLYFVRVA